MRALARFLQERRAPFYFLLGFALLGAVALAVSRAPSVFFAGSSVSSDGIRLLRDDYEPRLYWNRMTWRRIGPSGEPMLAGYPPLGSLYLSFPAVFAVDTASYRWEFVALEVIVYGLLLAAVAAGLRAYGKDPLRIAFLFLPAALYFSLWRHDAFPALLTVLGAFALAAGSVTGAVFAFWAATVAKGYALLFFLPLLMHAWPDRKKRRAFLRAVAICVPLSVLLYLVPDRLGLPGVKAGLSFQGARFAEIGSLHALLGYVDLSLIKPGTVGFKVARAVFSLLQFGTASLLLFRDQELPDARSVMRACLALLIPFMAFGEFFSQQWVLWLTPLAILVVDGAELPLLIALDLICYLQFPVLYDMGSHGAVALDLLTLARTVVLLVLWRRSIRALPHAKWSLLPPRH